MVDKTFDATDLDSPAADMLATVHEDVVDSQHNNDSLLKPGMPVDPLIKPQNAVLYYLMQETAGSTMIDFSGNGNDGTYNGVSLSNYDTFLNNEFKAFDGTDDYADTPSITLDGAGTILFWLDGSNVSSTATNPHFVRDLGDGDDYIIHDASTGEVLVSMNGTTFQGGTADQFYFTLIAVTSDGSTGKLFVGNTQEASAQASWSITDSQLRIGNNSALNEPFDGRLGFFGVWDTALTASEIDEIRASIAQSNDLVLNEFTT